MLYFARRVFLMRRFRTRSGSLRQGFETAAQLLVAGGEFGTALLEQIYGAGGIAGQIVDIAVRRLHFGQYVFELGNGLCVGWCLLFHIILYMYPLLLNRMCLGQGVW